MKKSRDYQMDDRGEKKDLFVSSVDTHAQLWTDIGVMAFAKHVRYTQWNNRAMNDC